MYLDYLKERYEDADFGGLSFEAVAENFEQMYRILGRSILKTDVGFVAYKIQGDAVLLLDMYVSPEFRGSKHAWKLHDILIEAGRKLNKCVMITFSELHGKNRHLGLAAIEAASFVPSFTTNNEQVFIKGI